MKVDGDGLGNTAIALPSVDDFLCDEPTGDTKLLPSAPRSPPGSWPLRLFRRQESAGKGVGEMQTT
jgi:hypothetical protein